DRNGGRAGGVESAGRLGAGSAPSVQARATKLAALRRTRAALARVESPVQGLLERAVDDVGRVRVVSDVRRDRVDRLLVAVQRIDAVDAPVVEPVRDDLLAALRPLGGCG